MRAVTLHNLAPLLVLAAVLATSAWPLFDHHFAERQPGHRHIGVESAHVHGHTGHEHEQRAPSDSPSPLALYFLDGSMSGPITVVGSGAVSQSFFLFEPSSLLLLNPASYLQPRQFLDSSLDKPPRLAS